MRANPKRGNMYDWITHLSTHIGGECPHMCRYCGIQRNQHRFKALPYKGELVLQEKEFSARYGCGKTIFLENCNDLFACGVRDAWIRRILNHANEWPFNEYLIQTKNPKRILTGNWDLPPNHIIGTTIETNRENMLSHAPRRASRRSAIRKLGKAHKVMISIEPVMAFDLDAFTDMILGVHPYRVMLGADSQKNLLPEPTSYDLYQLIDRLTSAGVDVRLQKNLNRLLRSV